MDQTARKITKIAREVRKFTTRSLKADGLGAAELDFIHIVRKNPGITQAGVRSVLGIDKGACARRAANLEQKGYLIRTLDPDDKRARRLMATAKADALKQSKAAIEAEFYAWLLEEFSEAETEVFVSLLNRLYLRCKKESQAGFPHVSQRLDSPKED